MRQEYVPIDQPLDGKGTIAHTLADVERLCPWAEEIIAVEGGYRAFESPNDAETWRRQG